MPVPVHTESELHAIKKNDHVILKDSISLTETPSYTFSTFTGELNGNNHTITGLTNPLFEKIEDGMIQDLTLSGAHITTDQEKIGTLCQICENSTLTNVTVQDSTVQTGKKTGGLVGKVQDSYIQNCLVKTSEVKNGRHSGGIVGVALGGTITRCESECKIQDCSKAGGIAETITRGCTVKNCKNNGDISAEGCTGGLVGYNHLSVIKSCVNYGEINSQSVVGGVVGRLKGEGLKLENNGDVNGTKCVGGVIGINNSHTTELTNTGTVIGDKLVGGVVGSNTLSVEKAKNTGLVNGEKVVGGLIGQLDASSKVEQQSLSDSYANCTVRGGDSVAGAIGEIESGTSEIENVYYIGALHGTVFTNPIVGKKNDSKILDKNVFWDTNIQIKNTPRIGTQKQLSESDLNILVDLSL